MRSSPQTSAVSNDRRLPQRVYSVARTKWAELAPHSAKSTAIHNRRRHRPRNQRFRTALPGNLALLPQTYVARLHSPDANDARDLGGRCR